MVKEQVNYYKNFDEIEKKIWNLLTRAVNDRNSEFRNPVFICGNNIDVDGRVVVLRKADQKNRFLQFHSDIRSSKINFIKNKSSCSLLFYGKKEKIQLRMRVNAKIHYKDEITESSWKKTGHISRKCYLVSNPPGSVSASPTSGLSEKFDKFDFSIEESEKGYENFCVIKCKINTIEWLYLAARGHRRALIDLKNTTKFSWLIP